MAPSTDTTSRAITEQVRWVGGGLEGVWRAIPISPLVGLRRAHERLGLMISSRHMLHV